MEFGLTVLLKTGPSIIIYLVKYVGYFTEILGTQMLLQQPMAQHSCTLLSLRGN